MKTVFEKVFQLSKHKTTAKTEVMAGITTFMTMAYILAVNPSVLSAAGMDATAVLLATALSSFIGTACMALMANLPFALSAGMGLNAFLAYTVVLGMGYTWQVALLAVFVEGLIFVVLSLTNVREAIFNAIPLTLKRGVSVGIGLFICFIGLQNAGLAVDSATLVTITSFTENFSTHGICALLALIGLFIMAALYLHHVRGAILLGILATWVIGMICQVAGIYVPDPANGFYTLFPTMALTDFSKLGLTFGQCFNVDFSNVGIVNFIIVVFSFLFVDIFDTLGTLIGVATKADMLDEEGRLPGIKPALMADAIGTTVGAVMGTSTITTFVESASGVAVGGRTGLTALTTGLLFLASMFFAPIFTAIPSFATAPALMMVGYLMVSTVTEIRFDEDNMAEAIPAYLAIVAMPLFYSISEGISMGIISYVVLHVLSGKGKQVKPLMYVLAVLFVLKYDIGFKALEGRIDDQLRREVDRIQHLQRLGHLADVGAEVRVAVHTDANVVLHAQPRDFAAVDVAARPGDEGVVVDLDQPAPLGDGANQPLRVDGVGGNTGVADQVDAGVIHGADIRLGVRVRIQHGHDVFVHAGDAETDVLERAGKVFVQMAFGIPEVKLHAGVDPNPADDVRKLGKRPRRPDGAGALHAEAVVGHAQGFHALLSGGGAVFLNR